jgi:alkaline phosphatase
VILGGGRQCLVSGSEGKDGDPLDSWTCRREDGLDLIQDWIRDKKERNLRHAFVNTTASLGHIHSNNTDYLLGQSFRVTFFFTIISVIKFI